jgi:hypothetical protein
MFMGGVLGMSPKGGKPEGSPLRFGFAVCLSSLFLCWPAPSAMAQPQTVGLATDVRGLVTGDLRTLTVGSDVYFNETVRTDNTSRVRLQFLDQTQLYIAQASEVVLDRFVFDPARNAGEFAVSLVRGTFRFVTGLQDSSAYEVTTPIATIGVRGTIWHALLAPNLLLLALEEGSIYAQLPNGLIIELDQPGWCLEIHADSTIVGPVPCEGPIDDPWEIGWNDFNPVGAPGDGGRPFNFSTRGNGAIVVPCLVLSCN